MMRVLIARCNAVDWRKVLGLRTWARRRAGLGLLLLGLLVLGACERTPPTGGQPPTLRSAPVPQGVVPVRVQKTAQGFRLLRGGRRCWLRGGGGLQQFGQLRAAGGNSIRLWSADYAGPLLDNAHRHGLTVMLGLWLEAEDEQFSYYDPVLVRAQRERVRQQVLRYRRHPALLMWNVGNELEYSATGPRVFEAVNEIARMIHALDPYHPVTISVSLGNDFVKRAAQLQQIAPAVDILSINTYGELSQLPGRLRASGWRGAYIMTEYGNQGYWESDSTTWGAPQEQTSAAKASFMRTGYREIIEPDSNRCLGSYAFFWGSKFEYTPTWFSLFEPTGEKTEMVDELHWLWGRRYPANRAPHLTGLRLAGRSAADNVRLQAGRSYPAAVTVTDPEGDSLTVRWEIMPEMRVGSSIAEMMVPLEPVPGPVVVRQRGRQARVRMPAQPGAYRLYVRVFDGQGSVATANIPMLVVGEQPALLPFAVAFPGH